MHETFLYLSQDLVPPGLHVLPPSSPSVVRGTLVVLVLGHGHSRQGGGEEEEEPGGGETVSPGHGEIK